MAFLNDIIPILIPIIFIGIVLYILNKQFDIFYYANEYGRKLINWLKSGAR